ncbi:hypothetical protein CEXT_458211 [Caerostris extrusa]|uniref:Secreted protein n=1 Tax=Caerostris extrusa TaxID=172846 RepID=A0AAV4YCW5_CAEEX|nr:hypothetical protein CEXT_458211 [Caerostris extrusa]
MCYICGAEIGGKEKKGRLRWRWCLFLVLRRGAGAEPTDTEAAFLGNEEGPGLPKRNNLYCRFAEPLTRVGGRVTRRGALSPLWHA